MIEWIENKNLLMNNYIPCSKIGGYTGFTLSCQSVSSVNIICKRNSLQIGKWILMKFKRKVI